MIRTVNIVATLRLADGNAAKSCRPNIHQTYVTAVNNCRGREVKSCGRQVYAFAT